MYGFQKLTGRAQHLTHFQRVLNEHWPPPEIARRLRDVPGPAQIDVWVRIEWERQGEEVLSGRAARWDRHHVFIYVDDTRLQIGGLWVSPQDVKRKNPAGPSSESTS